MDEDVSQNAPRPNETVPITRRAFGQTLGIAAVAASTLHGLAGSVSAQSSTPRSTAGASDELCDLSAIELAARIRRKDVSAREVMTADPAGVPELQAHQYFSAAVPTPDHFIPLLYLAGLAASDGKATEVLVDGYAMGSLSMTAYTLGCERIVWPQAERGTTRRSVHWFLRQGLSGRRRGFAYQWASLAGDATLAQSQLGTSGVDHTPGTVGRQGSEGRRLAGTSRGRHVATSWRSDVYRSRQSSGRP